jgi:hypothetical protein
METTSQVCERAMHMLEDWKLAQELRRPIGTQATREEYYEHGSMTETLPR